MDRNKTLLSISRLKKSYGKKNVLNDIDLQIKEGEIVGLLGENGAGKTTLMNCITGVVPYSQGDILYSNKSLRKYSQELKKFGILVHAKFLDYLTAEENLRVLGMYSGINQKRLEEEVTNVLKMVGLYEKKDEYTTGFSFGQLQRLGVAQAVLGEKKCLVLDEPFVGLDSSGKEILEKIILELAKEKGCSVLLSSHDMEEVERICDSIAIIKDGSVVYRDKLKKEEKIIVQVTATEHELREYLSNMKIEDKIQIIGKDKLLIKSTDIQGDILNVLGRAGVIKRVDWVSTSVGKLFDDVIQGKI